MGNLCGISLEAAALNDQIDAAKGAVNGLIADADKGIAASIATLKADLNSITDDIKGKLDGMVPEIPAPLAKLQDKVTSLVNNIQSPGGFLEELNDIKGKFPTLSLDEVISKVGIDPKKAKEADDKLKALQAKGNALIATIPNLQSSINNPFLYNLLPTEVKIALGDKKAIDAELGKGLSLTAPGFNISDQLDKICVTVPNTELTPEGKEVEKGTPTKAPTVDAAPAVDPPAPKGPEIVPPTKPTNVAIKESTTVDVISMSPERSKVMQKYNDRINEIRNRWMPKIDSLKADIVKYRAGGERMAPFVRTNERNLNSYVNLLNASNEDAATIRERELKAAGLTFDKTKISDHLITKLEWNLQFFGIEPRSELLKLETWFVI